MIVGFCEASLTTITSGFVKSAQLSSVKPKSACRKFAPTSAPAETPKMDSDTKGLRKLLGTLRQTQQGLRRPVPPSQIEETVLPDDRVHHHVLRQITDRVKQPEETILLTVLINNLILFHENVK
jgi:hypothetical protein